MDTERKWSLKLSGEILFADMSQVLEFFRVILFIGFHRERGGGGEERETDRQTDRQTDKQTVRMRERERDRQTDR